MISLTTIFIHYGPTMYKLHCSSDLNRTDDREEGEFLPLSRQILILTLLPQRTPHHRPSAIFPRVRGVRSSRLYIYGVMDDGNL